MKHLFPVRLKKMICLALLCAIGQKNITAQNYTGPSMLYNGLIGAVSGGIGSVINKHKDQKWYKAFAKGFVVGAGGGMIMYGGKSLNSCIATKRELGYGYLSKFVFDAGNSIVENAAANRNFWEVWHYDVSFIRIELQTKKLRLRPQADGFYVPGDRRFGHTG